MRGDWWRLDGELFVYGLKISERTVLNDYDLMKKDQFDDDFTDCEFAEKDEFSVDLTGEMQVYLLVMFVGTRPLSAS